MFFGLITTGEERRRETEIKEKSTKDKIIDFVQDTLNNKAGNENDLKEVFRFLKSLPRTIKKDDLLDIFFDIATSPNKKERKRNEPGPVTFQVIISDGKYDLIPINSVEKGFDLLGQVEQTN